EIGCETNITDGRFPTTPESIVRVRCPNCNTASNTVFGTEIYHPLSSICKAALHAGVALNNNELLVTILQGKDMYNGSTGADRSTSGTMGKSELSFKVLAAPSITNIDCSTTANFGKFGNAPIY